MYPFVQVNPSAVGSSTDSLPVSGCVEWSGFVSNKEIRRASFGYKKGMLVREEALAFAGKRALKKGGAVANVPSRGGKRHCRHGNDRRGGDDPS